MTALTASQQAQKWAKKQALQPKPNKATAVKDFFTDLTVAVNKIGWTVKTRPVPSMYAYQMEFVCPHGTHYIEQISGQLILFANGPGAVIGHIVSRLPSACPQEHEVVEPTPEYADAWKYAYFTAPVTWTYSIGGNSVVDGLSKLVPAISTELVACPACIGVEATIARVIPHINDTHQWSRERIADWLDTLDIDLTIRPQEEDECPSEPTPSATLPVETTDDAVMATWMSYYTTITLGNSSLTQIGS